MPEIRLSHISRTLMFNSDGGSNVHLNNNLLRVVELVETLRGGESYVWFCNSDIKTDSSVDYSTTMPKKPNSALCKVSTIPGFSAAT